MTSCIFNAIVNDSYGRILTHNAFLSTLFLKKFSAVNSCIAGRSTFDNIQFNGIHFNVFSNQDGFDRQIRIKTLFLEPREIKQLGLVLQTGVAQEGHNGLSRAAFLGQPHRAREINPELRSKKKVALREGLMA